MKSYSYKDSPIRVFGIPFFDERKVLERLPEDVREKAENLRYLGRRTSGVRIAFRTNSRNISIKVTLTTLVQHPTMSIFGGHSSIVVIGERKNCGFAGHVNPPDYETREFEKSFTKSDDLEDVTIYLTRNDTVGNVVISIDDDAIIEEPTPYKNGTVVFYGSSITEGGCCTRVTNAYTALLSDRMDFDYYNLGFAGSALGEPWMAEYVRSVPCDVFVLDYDHNAPDPEHLRRTHEPFFKMYREKHPTTPVLMLTKPDAVYDKHAAERCEIIRTTYNNAVASGDENVWFIDGSTYFGDIPSGICTVDRCHPNDIGMFKMAEKIEPVLREMLEKALGRELSK